MKIFLLLLSCYLPSFIYGQFLFTKTDMPQPAVYLQNIISMQDIETVAIIRQYGKMTDTTHHAFIPEHFLWGNKLLLIQEEVIALDSIHQGTISKYNGRQTLFLHSMEKVRTYNKSIASAENLAMHENFRHGEELIGQAAIDFAGTTLAGTPITLSDLRGKPILLNFWFLGCLHCRREFPDLNKIKENYPDINIITIAIDDRATLLKFIRIKNNGNYELREPYNYFGNDLLFEVIPDGKIIHENYAFDGFPINFFINSEGIIQFVTRYINYAHLAEKVQLLLKR